MLIFKRISMISNWNYTLRGSVLSILITVPAYAFTLINDLGSLYNCIQLQFWHVRYCFLVSHAG